jgi:predicted transcriptional regulator of viral defense system
MKQTLGNLERQLFAYTQMRGLGALHTGDLRGPLRILPKQERELLNRLSRAGWIARVRRGYYLVPPRLPLGGTWSPDGILALNTLLEDKGGRYQICGPNAFNRYGFDPQVPARIYAYNNRLSEERKIGSVSLTLIKVADGRLGGVETARTAEGLTAVYSSRVRTLVDAVRDWPRFDSLPRGFEWMRKELAAGRVNAEELAGMTEEFGNQGTVRRVGAFLEAQGAPGKVLGRLERKLARSTSLIPWIPLQPKRGKISRRWGVVLNGKA